MPVLPNTQKKELDDFFQGFDESRALFDALLELIKDLGGAELKITKSQIAFCLKKPFAWVWIPGSYLKGKAAPLVLSIAFPYRDPSPRWKEIIEPSPGRFMHHLEIYNHNDINDEVKTFLQLSYKLVGQDEISVL